MSGAAWIRELAGSDSPPEPAVEAVVLLDYPVALGGAQNERTNDLLREFQLMAAGGTHHDPSSPLARLESLAGELTDKYGSQLAEPAAELRRALASGTATTVLRYPLTRETRAFILDYAVLMEDVDSYCRDARLITLEPAADIYALRRWIVEEFVRQYDGLPPRPWPGVPAAGATQGGAVS